MNCLTALLKGLTPLFRLFIKRFLSFDRQMEECVSREEKGSISEIIVGKTVK